MEEQSGKIDYSVKVGGTDEASAGLDRFRESVVNLREQMAALKEEPLKVAPEGEKKEEKKDKGKEKAAAKRVSDMFASGLVQGIKSGDVKGALAGVGTELAGNVASGLISKGIKSVLSMIPGFGMIASFLPFQEEGLVTRPTLPLRTRLLCPHPRRLDTSAPLLSMRWVLYL